jgi:hypothetical protein
MESGVKAWQACAQSQVGSMVHTNTRIFAAAFYPGGSFTQAIVYGFNAADGSTVFSNATFESEPVGFITDEAGNTLFVATFAFNTPKVTALSGVTGAVLWTSSVYDSPFATDLFPPKLENGLLYACVALSQFKNLPEPSVICVQIAIDTGKVTETIHVPSGLQDLFFSGGRCFTLTQGALGWAVVELFWGASDTPPEPVVTLPAPNCISGSSREVAVLGTTGPLLALLVSDQCLLASTFTIYVYNLVAPGPFPHLLVWGGSNVVLARGEWRTTLAVESATVDPDAGLVYVTTATFSKGLLLESGTAFCVLSFFTGDVIDCYPAKSFVPVAAAGGVVNGTALVGVAGGDSVTSLTGLGRPVAPPDLTTVSPLPPPTVTPLPTPSPTTATTPAPVATTSTPPTPSPPPTTTTSPPSTAPHPTATPTTTPAPPPPPPSSAAPSSAAGGGLSGTVLGAGIGGGVLLILAGVLGCCFCVRRRSTQEEPAGGDSVVAPLNSSHADDSLTTIDIEGDTHHRRAAASTA